MLDESAQNHVLWYLGMAFTNSYADLADRIDLSQSFPQRAHAGWAIESLAASSSAQEPLCEADLNAVESALRALPLARAETESIQAAIRELIKNSDSLDTLFGPHVPWDNAIGKSDSRAAEGAGARNGMLYPNPRGVKKGTLNALHVSWLTHFWETLPPALIPAAPGIVGCHGCDDAVCISLDGACLGWQSTGISQWPCSSM